MNQKAIERIEQEIQPLVEQLNTHSLYQTMKTKQHVNQFMQWHVFAVWDFMSLLKSLQNQLTTVRLPWLPAENETAVQLVNEIVLGEESDIDEDGQAKSHFRMYVEAMQELGADTSMISKFIHLLKEGQSINHSLDAVDAPTAIKEFVKTTFSFIETEKPHVVTSAFTFGREDILPELFLKLVDQLDEQQANYQSLRYYLNRHIELDGDKHGPMAMKMISSLCGQHSTKWQEVEDAAKKALTARLNLWNAIEQSIKSST